MNENIIKIDSVRFYWSKKSNFKIFVPNLEIKKGEKFTTKNLTIKRPGDGISPMQLFKVIGKIAKRNFSEDELIKL